MEVACKLWEGSWDDGALLQDRALSLYGDPTKAHRINHSGKRYRVEGLSCVAADSHASTTRREPEA